MVISGFSLLAILSATCAVVAVFLVLLSQRSAAYASLDNLSDGPSKRPYRWRLRLFARILIVLAVVLAVPIKINNPDLVYGRIDLILVLLAMGLVLIGFGPTRRGRNDRVLKPRRNWTLVAIVLLIGLLMYF